MLYRQANFDYAPESTTRICYGKGRLVELLDVLKSLGCSRPLLVTSASIRKAGLADRVERILGESRSATFDGTRPHSPIECVRKAYDLFISADADSVVSLGGGSSVDTGKGVVHLHLDEKMYAIPHVAVPTTFSGAEFTQDAGITYGTEKEVHHGAHLMATVAVLDPEAALVTPASLLLPSGMNALHHCIEGVCSIKANGISDALFLRAIRLLSSSLPEIYLDTDNVDLRGLAQVGAALAALAIGDLPMGLGHAFAHAICGRYKTPHARTHALLIAPVMEYNRHAVPAAQAAIGEALGVNPKQAPEAVAEEGIGRVRDLLVSLGLPKTLSELGIRETDETLVENVMADRYFCTNPRNTEREDILAVIRRISRP
jgi:maleylacetate reductase